MRKVAGKDLGGTYGLLVTRIDSIAFSEGVCDKKNKLVTARASPKVCVHPVTAVLKAIITRLTGPQTRKEKSKSAPLYQLNLGRVFGENWGETGGVGTTIYYLQARDPLRVQRVRRSNINRTLLSLCSSYPHSPSSPPTPPTQDSAA